ncbi:hypothetical protein Tco_0833067 [Tanacetum coccineum]
MQVESEMLNLLKINADLFTCDMPLGKNFDEFSRLSRMDDNLFAYEYERMFIEAVILINRKLIRLIDITLEQWLDLKFGDHRKVDKEVMESVVSTWLIRSYKKQFEEYMKIKSEVPWVDEKPWLEDGTWKEPIEDISHARAGKNNDDTIETNQEWFDEHKSKGDNDNDIEDLDDYLVCDDAPFIVNEDEERFKEKRCKLHGIPYMKPPTCKSEKFEVVDTTYPIPWIRRFDQPGRYRFYFLHFKTLLSDLSIQRIQISAYGSFDL